MANIIKEGKAREIIAKIAPEIVASNAALSVLDRVIVEFIKSIVMKFKVDHSGETKMDMDAVLAIGRHLIMDAEEKSKIAVKELEKEWQSEYDWKRITEEDLVEEFEDE